MTPFGQKMRELRALKGVNQAEMAEAIGVSPAYLSALEHGKKGQPSFPMMQNIIEYFGLIWDEAEMLTALAEESKPRVTIDTAGMDERATRIANMLSRRLGRLSVRELDQILAILESGNRP